MNDSWGWGLLLFHAISVHAEQHSSWWTNKASQVNLLKGGEEQPHFYGMRIEDSRLLFNLSAASCNRDKIGTIPKKKQEAELSLWSRKFSPSKWKKT